MARPTDKPQASPQPQADEPQPVIVLDREDIDAATANAARTRALRRLAVLGLRAKQRRAARAAARAGVTTRWAAEPQRHSKAGARDLARAAADSGGTDDWLAESQRLREAVDRDVAHLRELAQ